MRRGFLLAMAGLGALALLAVIFIPPRHGATTTSTTQPSAVSADGPQHVEAPASEKTNPAERTAPPPGGPIATANATGKDSESPEVRAREELRASWVAARIAELGELSTKTDRVSLETLLSEVRNPDPEIREAALDAISQSGNRAAIPGLREAAGQTEDAREKREILEVIDFLSLPTLTEILSGRGATNSPRPAQRGP